jgi:hypothetical protein
MEPQPDNKKGLLMIVGAIILVAIVCLGIVLSSTGAFFSPPQKQIPVSQDITTASIGNSIITPLTGPSGTNVPVTITGTDFSYGPSPSVWLSKPGFHDIYAADVAVISPTQITCVFPLSAASIPAGQWDVFIRNVNEPSGSKIGVFTIVNEVSQPLTWNWSADGWGDWQHRSLCKGTTTGSGSCREVGPVIENGHGIHGSDVTLDRVPTESSVGKTFVAPNGTRWKTLTFNGRLSSTSLPFARWMAIEVNGERVFYANATQTPPGNDQEFTITPSFTPANSVYVRIVSGQDPTWDTPLYTMQFNTLTMS